MIMDEYQRPIHPEVEDYMRRYVTEKQDCETVDDKDCWGMNYTGPTTEIRENFDSLLHTCGGGHPVERQEGQKQQKPERPRYSVPQASRDPKILEDMNLGNEDIFDIIRSPPDMGVVRIFEKPEFWDTIRPNQSSHLPYCLKI